MVASNNQEKVNKKVHHLFFINRIRKVAERSMKVTQVMGQVTRVKRGEKILQGPEGFSQMSSFKVAIGITGSVIKMAGAPA